jgi:CBS domain-containing protein
MVTCPSCDKDNVAGVEICESCGQDLLDSGVPTPLRGIQAAILATPLEKLEPIPSIIVDRSTTVAAAMKEMREKRHGSVIVTDGGKMAGIFTERDVLMKIIGKDVDPAELPVGEVMTQGPQWLRGNDPLAYAIHLMAVRGYRHIPVTEDGTDVSMVSIRGIIGYLTRKAL